MPEETIKPPAPTSPAPFVVDTQMPDNLKGQSFSDEDVGISEDFTTKQNLNEDGSTNSPELERLAADKKAKQEAKTSTEKQVKAEGEESTTTKVEEKKEDKKPTGLNIPKDEVKEEKKPDAAKPAEGVKPVGEDKRGLANYPETIRESLKKMSNEAFEVFKQTWKEKEESAKKLVEFEGVKKKQEELEKNGYPSDWANHPDAYTLHPAYKEASRVESLARAEENFYYQQLQKIAEGEEFQVVQGYDGKTGRAILSEAFKPSKGAEIEVTRLMNSAGNVANQQIQKIQSIQQTFGQQYQAAKQSVDKIIDEQWPWFNKEGADKRPEFAHAQALYQATPPQFRNHPSTVVAGLLYSSLQQALGKIQELQGQVEKKQVLQEEKTKVEENISSPPKTKADNNKFVSNLKRLTGDRHARMFAPPETFDIEGMD